jgi:hypothetical protein
MSLATYADVAQLYRARGPEVSPHRPLFTGDVLRDVSIPGLPGPGMAVVVAHPCSFRGRGGRLNERVLVARVNRVNREGPFAWPTRFFDRMPLPDVDGEGHWAGFLEEIGLASSEEVIGAQRLACLSDFGINMLQQRLTCHFTRAKVPTHVFNEAFSHTYEEAELLEDWTSTLCEGGFDKGDADISFDQFMGDGTPSRRKRLEDPQQRSAIRRDCRQQAATLVRNRANRLG